MLWLFIRAHPRRLAAYKKREEAMLLVQGIDPIYATRVQSTQYQEASCGKANLGPSERLRLIAEMLSIPPEEMQWQTRLETTI